MTSSVWFYNWNMVSFEQITIEQTNEFTSTWFLYFSSEVQGKIFPQCYSWPLAMTLNFIVQREPQILFILNHSSFWRGTCELAFSFCWNSLILLHIHIPSPISFWSQVLIQMSLFPGSLYDMFTLENLWIDTSPSQHTFHLNYNILKYLPI